MHKKSDYADIKEPLDNYSDKPQPRDENGWFKTKYDPSYKDKIIEKVSLCLSERMCAHLVGVSPEVLNKWLKQGQKDLGEGKQTDLADLCKSFRAAQAELAMTRHDTMLTPNLKNWGAFAFSLERLYSQVFGKNAPDHDVLDVLKQFLEEKSLAQGGAKNGRTALRRRKL